MPARPRMPYGVSQSIFIYNAAAYTLLKNAPEAFLFISLGERLITSLSEPNE